MDDLSFAEREFRYVFTMLQVGHSAPDKIFAYIGRPGWASKIRWAKYPMRDSAVWGHRALLDRLNRFEEKSGAQ